MQNLFPFEKNRYFPYKRMRSEDFDRELQYMDHKFQCLNRWTFGAGIAFGLEARRLGDESLMVSQGLAVDRQGRYLIVDEPVVFRLRTLEGFRELPADTALLRLRYREEPGRPMLVPRDHAEAEEFSVSTERCSFCLTPLRPEPPDTADRVLYFDRELYADDTLRVRQILPDLLSSRQPVKLRLIFENLTSDQLPLKLHYAPKLPGFHMQDRDGICFDWEEKLSVGATVKELLLIPATSAQSVCFTLSGDDFSVELPGREVGLAHGIRQELRVISGDPVAALAGRICAMSPQELWGEEEEDGIPIAVLRLLRCEEEVLLEDVIPLYEQQRAHLPALEQRLKACRDFFPGEQAASVPVDIPQERPREPEFSPDWDRYMTTGVVSLNAGLHLRRGKVLCTGEIPHNLGPGTVYMDFGIEKVLPSADENRNIRSIVLGDASLFIPAEGDYEHNFDRAVCIHPEKGTFELSVRLREELHEPTLQLRWYAWRPERAVAGPAADGILLRLEPNVVYAQPGEEIFFSPIFRGPGSTCEFFVEEKQAGLITGDGVYTAPEKDGLYQVCAQVKDRPETRIGAFVIVRSVEEGAEDDRTEL